MIDSLQCPGQIDQIDNLHMNSKTDCEVIAPVPFRQALWFWFKLGFISFGGPAGQIAMMHEALVSQRRWLSENRFLHALNYCMLLPGPEAQQLATYIGWLMHKTKGGIAAGVLFVLPSLCLLIGLSWVYVAYGQLTVVAGLLWGIKPAVAALVLQATLRMGARSLRNLWLWLIAIASFVAIFVLKLAFPLIVLMAALAGWSLGRWAPASISPAPGHAAAHSNHEPAWINDDTPTPAHAMFKWAGLCKVLFVGLFLWLLPMSVLLFFYGWEHSLTQMSWFFTKAAFLTFGGAYAVLPYVYQGAVEQFGWLTPLQMMDGLALGESTPGPLIMVVSFVGFVGAYVHQLLGPDNLFAAGLLAACLVTWFTFLPSFVFILGGGPFIESTHQQLAFTAPLTAITAAVVGVIFNLALFFNYHVLWPAGLNGSIDSMAALMVALCAVALVKFKANVIGVLTISALLGWGWQTLQPLTH